MKNRGFSIVQIIIAITVTGVVGGVVCPFGFRFAEQTRRMRDVYEASEIAHQFQLMVSYYGGFPEDIAEENAEDAGVLNWQKEEWMKASGLTEDEVAAIGTEVAADGQYGLDQLLFYHLEKIPESVTDPDYMWNLHYNEKSGTVESIFLVEKNASGNIVSEMEVYPNYSDFVALN